MNRAANGNDVLANFSVHRDVATDRDDFSLQISFYDNVATETIDRSSVRALFDRD